MASASLNRLGAGTLVFVPGIMGSGLEATGVGHNGLPRVELIWGEDLTTIFRTLASEPALLGAAAVQVTGIIRKVKLGLLRTKVVYGSLLDFCTSSTGLDLEFDRNFVTFPYDWRDDLRTTADKLEQVVSHLPQPVFIVAHSMGGLVTRLVLEKAGKGAAKVEGVFQIASPVAGSSKAFKTLRKGLDIGPLADAFWKFWHRLNITKQAALTRAIGSMTSLYQLLPGDGILILAGGTLASPLDVRAWSPADHVKLACANATRASLAAPLSVPIRCVFSASTPTDWLIAVDNNWSMLGVAQVADGDGTVTSTSARAHSVDHVPVVDNSGTEHTELCSHPRVHDLLRAFLS